ncbi:MAG: transmembrane 220 family protein [Phycisphaerales bacterium]
MPRLITGLLFVVLFALAAFVQRDDIDTQEWTSYFWIGVYGAAAVLSLLFAVGFLPRWLAWTVAIAAFGWAAGIIAPMWPPTAAWSPEEQFLAEEVREAGGVTLIGLWMIVAGCCGRRRKKAAAP